MLNLKSIVATLQPAGAYSFAVVLVIDGEQTVEIPVKPGHLMYYDEFVAHVLATTGRIYRSTSAEGRTPGMADYFHRLDVAALLEPTAAKASPIMN